MIEIKPFTPRVPTRFCIWCEQERPVDNFDPYRNHWCNDCSKIYQRIVSLYESLRLEPPTMSQLHRPFKHWRIDYRFDLLYPPFEDEQEKKAA